MVLMAVIYAARQVSILAEIYDGDRVVDSMRTPTLFVDECQLDASSPGLEKDVE